MLHPILKRLSHSSILLLHNCPRKYQLTKLLSKREEDNEDFSFGTAVGNGIQQLLIGQKRPEVVYELFHRWPQDLFEDTESAVKKKKTFFHVLHTLTLFEQRILPGLLADYEVAYFNGKPASELSFRIEIGADFFYRGFVDVVLIHKRTRELLVVEIKTTAARYFTQAKYYNSGQGLGYSLVCDFIAQASSDINSSSYKILYLVFKTTLMEFEPLPVPKSHSQRAQWIKELLLEVETVQLYDKNDCFPMHGESCESWGRVCDFFGTCQLSNNVLLQGANPELKEETFTFNIPLLALIDAQLSKHEQETV